MERIPSIIHKMQERYAEGASASELLFLLEDMRRELNGAVVPVDHTKAPVSVWLPQGYVGPQSGVVKMPSGSDVAEKSSEYILDNKHTDENSIITETSNGQFLPSENDVHFDKQEEKLPQEKVIQGNGTFPFMSVPRPPLVRVIETEPEDEFMEVMNLVAEPEVLEVPEKEQLLRENEVVLNEETFINAEVKEPVIQAFVPIEVEPVILLTNEPEIKQDLPKLDIESPVAIALEAKQAAENIVNPVIENPEEPEAPVVFELDLPHWETEPVQQKWEPLKIPDGFLVGSGFKESLVAEKPRELHEILANRVLAKPQGNNAGETSVGVMEKISGGKITDLRKGFSINDRFRFINSLFRGDEAMFDRAIKTINNFGILPEAKYWMQRELVIKLGWNDEDELVQHFYQLVTRRFL